MNELYAKIIKTENIYEQLVYAVVYPPYRIDTDLEFMRPETIRKIAHQFLRNELTYHIDIDHDGQFCGAYVVESFIAQDDQSTYIVGSWVLVVHIPDESIFQKVLDGEINGFSLQAMAVTIPRKVKLSISETLDGVTSYDHEHEHTYVVTYDPSTNRFVGQTNEVNGHFHHIYGNTITQTSDGHHHRYETMNGIEITEVIE